jgi:hypothetical protein
MSKLAAIFKNKGIQDLLRDLKEGRVGTIDPVIEVNGGVEYPILIKFFGSHEDAEAALLLLNEAGVLVGDIVDNIAVCPHCQSHRLLLRNRCPSCGSSKLVRGAMIEHLSCGHIDFRDRFETEEGLVCPKCRKPLGALGADYRTYSFLYRCIDCGGFFTDPRIEFSCDKSHKFDEREITIQSIKAYRLNPEKKDLLDRLTLNLEEAFKPILADKWRLEAPARVKGASGAEHEFSFALWNDRDVDKNGGGGKQPPEAVGSIHISSQAVTATDVLALWAKAVDAGAKHKVLATFSGKDEYAEMLAENYNVKIVSGSDSAEIKEKLRALIEEIAKPPEEPETQEKTPGEADQHKEKK